MRSTHRITFFRAALSLGVALGTGCAGDDVATSATDTDGGSSTTDASTTSTSTSTSGATTSTTSAGTAGETTGPTTGGGGVCGDGAVDPGEECDDGNADNTDACLDTCMSASCGDGFVQARVEACDDGNQVDDDACSNTCALPTCGDGAVQGDEECDDGNAEETDACLSTCLNASCGDGFVQDGVEACDDANGDDTDECPGSCQMAICGDGFVWADNEECDAGGESAECDDDCTAATCGDGTLNASAGEACDDGNDVNTDECVDGCAAAACGDGFVWADNEECDDGNTDPGDGCDGECKVESCVWDIKSLPLPITVHPNNFYGEIAFDKNCDLIVGGSFNHTLYRVDGGDGSVTTIAMNINGNSVNGVAYRKSDDMIYVAVDSPNVLYVTDGNGPLTNVVNLPAITNAIAVAPEGFGNYGDQIIGVTTAGTVIAVDPGSKMVSTVGTTNGTMSDLVFAPDGTLYVANYNSNRIDKVSSDGVFTQLIGGLSSPDGLAVDLDGSRLFVAQYAGGNRIDTVSLPGAVLTPGKMVTLDGGYYTTGIIIDGADHVIYKTSNGSAVIDAYDAP
ncbi:MAG: DUF4215 domain-containing protein [Myxococcales bacterium]|nr:DUF4215 domain-containing protein [Myxococcales bacterium]